MNFPSSTVVSHMWVKVYTGTREVESGKYDQYTHINTLTHLKTFEKQHVKVDHVFMTHW